MTEVLKYQNDDKNGTNGYKKSGQESSTASFDL
jgi:hypothetical protein